MTKLYLNKKKYLNNDRRYAYVDEKINGYFLFYALFFVFFFQKTNRISRWALNMDEADFFLH